MLPKQHGNTIADPPPLLGRSLTASLRRHHKLTPNKGTFFPTTQNLKKNRKEKENKKPQNRGLIYSFLALLLAVGTVKSCHT